MIVSSCGFDYDGVHCAPFIGPDCVSLQALTSCAGSHRLAELKMNEKIADADEFALCA
jgi:hypothetical protein